MQRSPIAFNEREQERHDLTQRKLALVNGVAQGIGAAGKPDDLKAPGVRSLRAYRLRSAFVIALAIWPPLICACLAQHLDRWEIFERSGSITTAIGLLVASRRHIRYGVLELAARQAHKPESDIAEMMDDILAAKLGLALSAFGTIIWGWGQYLGWWSFSCLLIWAFFAARDAYRDATI